MRAVILSGLAAGLLVAPVAQAQVVRDCQDDAWLASPANIGEPWDAQSRTFANGAIRIALIDTGGEPVCCSAHLLVLSPSGGQDGPEYRACRIVSGGQGAGFFAVDIAGTTAAYDPRRGLLLSVPVGHWHPGIETGRPPIWERLELRVNQATGTVAVE